MGVLRKCCTCTGVLLVVSSVLFVLALFLLPCMPPYVTFPEYTEPDPAPLHGIEALNEVKQMGAGELRGPEALAVRPRRSGDSSEEFPELFTGLLGGRVVRVTFDPSSEQPNVTTVTRLGHPECVTEKEGEVCGRPTGMQFHEDGRLYLLDAYHGLFRVDVDSGSFEHLAGGPQFIGGQRVRLASDLAVAKDGKVFWTDASTQAGPEDLLLELLAQPSGRLLRYDPRTNRTVTLIGHVHCAAGVALGPNEDFVLVAEAGKDRILRYHLKGSKKETWDIFTEGLPGVPAKIRRGGPGGEDGYLVTLAVTHPSSLMWLRHHPTLGRALMRLMASTEYIFAGINKLVNNTVSRDVAYMLGNPQLVAPLLHSSAVVALNSSGHIVNALSSSDGSLGVVSQLQPLDDFLYLASPYNNFLGRLNLTDALKYSVLGIGSPVTETPETNEVDDINPAKEPLNQIQAPSTEVTGAQESTTTLENIANTARADEKVSDSTEVQTTESVRTTESVKETEVSQSTESDQSTEASMEEETESNDLPTPVTEETTLSNQVDEFTSKFTATDENTESAKLLNLRDLIAQDTV